MTDWKWNGSRWWKIDFHAHTPASDDYGKGPNQETLKKRTPKEWVLDYMRAGVDCVAVTDHNTGAWIDQLKEALEELRAESHSDYPMLHLFPGMEISVNGGIHVLAFSILRRPLRTLMPFAVRWSIKELRDIAMASHASRSSKQLMQSLRPVEFRFLPM